jgi:hypothetical protein
MSIETKKPPEFCTNCGQPVKGELAERAANPAVVFCCECGVRLSPKGTCVNPGCPWSGKVPQC